MHGQSSEGTAGTAVALSVVVVTHEHRAALARTLPPLLDELGEGDELIVVDNASSDGTAAEVRRRAPAAHLIELGDNEGFAAAANAGAAAAHGDLIVLLNPDARPAPGFAEAIRRPLLDGRGWSAWMGLVTMDDGRLINTSAGVVHFTGIAWAGRVGEPADEPVGAGEVPFASGACMAVPSDEWRRAGGLPAEFFLYCEDVDLSLRLRLAGGRVGVEPAARVDHDYEFAKGAYKWRLLERNRWAVLLRTYPAPLLALLAPALAATELALLAVAVAGGWGREKALAWIDTLRALPRLISERRAVQGTRAVSAREFAEALTPDLDSPYLGRAGRLMPLRVALRAYWALVLALLPQRRRWSSDSTPAGRGRTPQNQR